MKKFTRIERAPGPATAAVVPITMSHDRDPAPRDYETLVRAALLGAGEFAGTRGPITEKIQSAFFDIVGGRNAKYAEWLTPV